jgi:putative tricarboxylic transport membrane protein
LTQKDRSIVSSLFCIVVGALFCIGSRKYGDLRAGFPNAGFFPFVGGALMILLSLIQLVATFLAKNEKVVQTVAFFPQRDTPKRLSVTLVILFLYGISLNYLGFLITTFLFIVALLKFLEPQKWTTVFIGAFLTSILSYTLFEILLKVQLPKGMIGI